MIKSRLTNLFDYVQFPITASVLSVEGIRLLERAGHQASTLTSHWALSGNVFNHAALGAAIGVAIGNCFEGSHHKSYALFVLPASAAGVVAGFAAKDTSIFGPYAAAFTAAATGMAFRRNVALPENVRHKNDLDC